MISRLVRGCGVFRRDRRGATAMVMAIALVPMIICSGAAVDFSRLAAARAQLQMAVDAAALAGVGAYQTSQQGSNAAAVVNATFTVSKTNLTNYLAISGTAVTIGCNGSAGDSNCGTASALGNVSSNYKACPNSADYCDTITATATLKNSLLGGFIPTDALTAAASATSPFPPTTCCAKNITSITVPNAYDENALYAYGVPMSSNNSPEYNTLPPAYSNCSGPVKNSTVAPTGTSCPYYQIGDSTGVTIPAQSQLSLKAGQPVAFLFENVTGNYHNYSYVGEPDGGYCPDFTLYGSLSQEPNTVVPLQDSINIYSSAYEVSGYPPSFSSAQTDEGPGDPYGANVPYGTNHAIVPFQVPKGTNVGTQYVATGYAYTTFYYVDNNAAPVSLTYVAGWSVATVSEDPSTVLYYQKVSDGSLRIYGGTGYVPVYGNGALAYGSQNNVASSKVENCPYYYYNYQGAPATYKGVGDGLTYSATSTNNGYPQWNATYFPNTQYYGGINPPQVVSGCTPNGSTTPWNYSGGNLGNCANGAYTTGGLSSGQQTTKYNNCALLIEDLGTGVTTLPTSYNEYQPSPNQNSKLTDVLGRPYFTADYSGVLQKGTSTEYYPPDDTAHKCWNPAETDSTATDYDRIENPQDGAVFCGASSPETYALYWNDMGSNESDDLGYWNAITLFTCSAPGSGSGGGGASSLSG